jgi:membrane-bound metal-dependent hydrolase YbcI (DUF457 family)
MQLLKDKRALSTNEGGHYIFSFILLALAILIILQFTKIPITNIILNNILLCTGLLLVYLEFSVFVDLYIEPPGKYNHRGFFHSLTCLYICMILVPITIEKSAANRYLLFGTSALCGHISHLWGDSLTSRLKKW